MKAILKNYDQSPRKVRLLADLVRGKKVQRALDVLRYTDKRAAEPFVKLIESALANAVTQGKQPSTLVVKAVSVNKGTVYKRFMPRARGSASGINRRHSHITVILDEQSATHKKRGTDTSDALEQRTQ